MTQTVQLPGLSDVTRTSVLIEKLRTAAEWPLEFHVNGTPLVSPGYHVTEVKAVTIEAMDCGGKANAWRETVIQLMDGSASDAAGGFMSNRKFLSIYDRVIKAVPVHDEAEVRFEYGNSDMPALQYHVSELEVQPQRVIVHLRTPGVQCKAGEACGLPASEAVPVDQSCAPGGNCCGSAPIELLTLS